MLRIGNVPATDLANDFGTPLYVYDAAVIRRQIANVKPTHFRFIDRFLR